MEVPLGIDTTGLATVRVKLGGALLTLTAITLLCVSAPLVAVIVTEPVVAVPDAVTVSVLVPAVLVLTDTGFGLSVHVRPLIPVHDVKFTLPLKPCTDATVMVSVVELPCVTVSVELPAVTVKSCTPTETLRTTELVLLVLVPVTVTVPDNGACEPDWMVRLADTAEPEVVKLGLS